MTTKSKWIVVTVAVAAFAFMGAPALAFHDGGVATCTRCHSMHSALSSDYLLVKHDQSSTCLSCHEHAGDTAPSSYHVSTAAADLSTDTDIPLQRGPGGDFGWLRRDWTAPGPRGNVTSYGYTHGHNIIAQDAGYTYIDGATAPGGSMPASQLACTSCHDPHSRARRLSTGEIIYPSTAAPYPPVFESGSYGFIPAAGEAAGVYRLLGGVAYQAYDGGPTFPGNPAAVAPSSYNRTEAVTQTRVAYGYGTSQGYASWSKWCATCHPGMHTDTASNLVHVVDAQLNGQADIYNEYVMTGNLTGVVGTSFTSLVPFAMNTNDTATLAAKALNDDSDLSGPASTDRIACLSCHRAHASGWQYALRWNQAAEFLTLADDTGASVYPGKELTGDLANQGNYNMGYTSAQMAAAYYDRPPTVFAPHQRSLCNKCHAKD